MVLKQRKRGHRKNKKISVKEFDFQWFNKNKKTIYLVLC